MLALAIALSAATVVFGFERYQMEIPNGANVPNWPGVGHQRALGRGDRNVFGQAFAGAGRTWTNTLCQADTDGDGQSNGLELGDPCCEWTKGGAAPEFTNAISHPALSAEQTTRSMPNCSATDDDAGADDGTDDAGDDDGSARAAGLGAVALLVAGTAALAAVALQLH